MPLEPLQYLRDFLERFGVLWAGMSRAELQANPPQVAEYFLTKVELSFYGVLQAAFGDQAAIFAKVSLADIFIVPVGRYQRSYRSQVGRTHIDFLLCDLLTAKPLCGVELTAPGNRRSDRAARDRWVTRVFKSADLPLFRLPAGADYSAASLQEELAPLLAKRRASVAAPPVQTSEPAYDQAADAIAVCRKCGAELVPKVAARRTHRGIVLWGCPNSPACAGE